MLLSYCSGDLHRGLLPLFTVASCHYSRTTHQEGGSSMGTIGGCGPAGSRGVVGGCLVDMERDTVPIRMLNPISQQYQVTKAADITICAPVTSVCVSPPEGKDGHAASNETLGDARQATLESLLQHLHDLAERNIQRLEYPEHTRVLDLLMEFTNTFYQNSKNLGRTKLVQHQIHTGAALLPIRQSPRHFPFEQQEVAQRQVEKWINRGSLCRQQAHGHHQWY